MKMSNSSRDEGEVCGGRCRKRINRRDNGREGIQGEEQRGGPIQKFERSKCLQMNENE